MSSRDQERRDRDFCEAQLPLVSRTFALSIEALPPGLRDPVRLAYLLCRIVDTVEDGKGLRLEQRQQLFDRFDPLMEDDERDPSAFVAGCQAAMVAVEPGERELCLGSAAVFRRFRALPLAQRQAIRPWVLEMSRGMRLYVERASRQGSLQVETMEDLEQYCYYVAGTVGRLLTELFLLEVPGLSPAAREAVDQRAVSFGLGLQMVNIVKDVAADLERGGHCFLPASLVRDAGVSRPADLLEQAHRQQSVQVVRAVCQRAIWHLRLAQEYTEQWPVPQGIAVRQFCAVPLALALATLREVMRGADTLRPGRNPKVSRETVVQIIAQSREAVASNEALGRLLEQHWPCAGG